MSQVNAQLYPGPFQVDLAALDGTLYDLPPGEMQYLRVEREGMPLVVAELAQSVPAVGVAAGVPPEVFTHVNQCTDRLQQIRSFRLTIAKLAEVLLESEAKYEHERENDLSIIADAVRSVAHRKGDPALLAAFEQTLKYCAQTAEKGVKTRKKNAEAKKANGQGGPVAPT
ncbi:MAG: hypothetical protein ABI193_00735 [Minicystis sp.]